MTKKYPLTHSKKRISSRNWKVDPTTGARFKTVLPTPAKNIKKSVQNESIEEVSNDSIKLALFVKNLKFVRDQLNGKRVKEILSYALEWIPKAKDYPKHVFAIFLNTNKLEKNALELLEQKKLLHGYANNYAIISTRNKDLEFYANSINFFHSFRSVMGNSMHLYQEPIVIRELTGFSANPTFLIFSNTNGRGLLVKCFEVT